MSEMQKSFLINWYQDNEVLNRINTMLPTHPLPFVNNGQHWAEQTVLGDGVQYTRKNKKSLEKYINEIPQNCSKRQ